MLKVAVSSPPEKGKANKTMLKLIADRLGVKANKLQIVTGSTSPRKEVAVTGVNVEEVRNLLGK
jgi:uncharacterized protein YggU (UPF0235/DUF167 family)